MLFSKFQYLWVFSFGMIFGTIKAASITLGKHQNDDRYKDLYNPFCMIPSEAEIDAYGKTIIEQALSK